MISVYCSNMSRLTEVVARYNIPALFHQQLRWRGKQNRMPYWLPRSRAKLYEIKEEVMGPREERQFVLQLTFEYMWKCDSLRKFFAAQLEKNSESGDLSLEAAKAVELEHQRLMEENRKENERVGSIREETMEELFQQNAEQLMKQYEKKLKVDSHKKIEIEKLVCAEKAKPVVTLETLDRDIEHAIDNPVNECFSIDTSGNIYWEGVPPKEHEEKVMKRFEM